jgi:hypothetical protein
MLHTQGQVTTGRLTTLLNDIGLDVSKRQTVRLLTRQMDGFVAEDAAVLHAGLVSSHYVTVDDTGARHSHNTLTPHTFVTQCIHAHPKAQDAAQMDFGARIVNCVGEA